AEWGRMSFQRRKPRRAWEAPGGSLRARSPCHKACAAWGLLSGRLLPCPSSARGPLCQVDRVTGLPHVPARSPSGGIGRRGRLKICCSQERAGSSPAWGTNLINCVDDEGSEKESGLFVYVRCMSDC